MNQTTCIHVHFKSNGTHFYFGSIAAIFELFTHADIGIKEHSLYDYDIEAGNEYSNKFVVIRKGPLRRKKTNRGQYVKKLHDK